MKVTIEVEPRFVRQALGAFGKRAMAKAWDQGAAIAAAEQVESRYADYPYVREVCQQLRKALAEIFWLKSRKDGKYLESSITKITIEYEKMSDR